MTKRPYLSASLFFAALILFAFAVGGAVLEIGTRDWPKSVILLAFGLLLITIGNLMPKIAPATTPNGEALSRNAGRTLLISGVAAIIFAAVAPPREALTASAIIAIVALAMAALPALSHMKPQRKSSMPSSRSTVFVAMMMLLVGLFGAFGLILIDRAFGDQAAQWSAIVWVLILGVVSSFFVKDLITRER